MATRILVFGVICAAGLFIAEDSFARCAPSFAYQTEFEVLSCQDEDPKDHSKILGGNGVILEVSVFSKKKLDGPEIYDWWPAKGRLPQRLRVFYDTNRKAPCVPLKPGTKRRGIMRALCCDGGEPRCDHDVSIDVHDLKK